MENAPNLFRNLLLLKATNTEAYTKCMQGVMQNVQEQAICNEEIHMRTPNSYMDYIEFLVNWNIQDRTVNMLKQYNLLIAFLLFYLLRF